MHTACGFAEVKALKKTINRFAYLGQQSKFMMTRKDKIEFKQWGSEKWIMATIVG